MRKVFPLCFALLAFTAAMRPCHAAAIAPKNDEEAKTQYEQALIMRSAMNVANKEGEAKYKRERAAQVSALMAMRNTAPSGPQVVEAVIIENRAIADRTGNLYYLAGIAAVVAAIIGFFYLLTRSAIAARLTGKKPKPKIATVPAMPHRAAPDSTKRKEFVNEIDQLIANIDSDDQ